MVIIEFIGTTSATYVNNGFQTEEVYLTASSNTSDLEPEIILAPPVDDVPQGPPIPHMHFGFGICERKPRAKGARLVSAYRRRFLQSMGRPSKPLPLTAGRQGAAWNIPAPRPLFSEA